MYVCMYVRVGVLLGSVYRCIPPLKKKCFIVIWTRTFEPISVKGSMPVESCTRTWQSMYIDTWYRQQCIIGVRIERGETRFKSGTEGGVRSSFEVGLGT